MGSGFRWKDGSGGGGQLAGLETPGRDVDSGFCQKDGVAPSGGDDVDFGFRRN